MRYVRPPLLADWNRRTSAVLLLVVGSASISCASEPLTGSAGAPGVPPAASSRPAIPSIKALADLHTLYREYDKVLLDSKIRNLRWTSAVARAVALTLK